MKKILTKTLACLMLALVMITTVSMYMPVDAAVGVQPYSYYADNFSFTGSCNISRDFTGAWLTFRVKGTAENNNNETIHLNVHILGRNTTKSYTFLTDGQTHEYKNIYIGLSGSSVVFNFNGQNPSIKINMYLEAGS